MDPVLPWVLLLLMDGAPLSSTILLNVGDGFSLLDRRSSNGLGAPLSSIMLQNVGDGLPIPSMQKDEFQAEAADSSSPNL